jgi:hypothetical protein
MESLSALHALTVSHTTTDEERQNGGFVLQTCRRPVPTPSGTLDNVYLYTLEHGTASDELEHCSWPGNAFALLLLPRHALAAVRTAGFRDKGFDSEMSGETQALLPRVQQPKSPVREIPIENWDFSHCRPFLPFVLAIREFHHTELDVG